MKMLLLKVMCGFTLFALFATPANAQAEPPNKPGFREAFAIFTEQLRIVKDQDSTVEERNAIVALAGLASVPIPKGNHPKTGKAFDIQVECKSELVKAVLYDCGAYATAHQMLHDNTRISFVTMALDELINPSQPSELLKYYTARSARLSLLSKYLSGRSRTANLLTTNDGKSQFRAALKVFGDVAVARRETRLIRAAALEYLVAIAKELMEDASMRDFEKPAFQYLAHEFRRIHSQAVSSRNDRRIAAAAGKHLRTLLLGINVTSASTTSSNGTGDSMTESGAAGTADAFAGQPVSASIIPTATSQVSSRSFGGSLSTVSQQLGVATTRAYDPSRDGRPVRPRVASTEALTPLADVPALGKLYTGPRGARGAAGVSGFSTIPFLSLPANQIQPQTRDRRTYTPIELLRPSFGRQ